MWKCRGLFGGEGWLGYFGFHHLWGGWGALGFGGLVDA
jgi:hypothetical protein